MHTSATHDDGAQYRDSGSTMLDRVIRAVASPFKPRPDRSLVNAKFTDALERELAGQAHRNGYW